MSDLGWHTRGRILFDVDGVLTIGVTDDQSSPDWQPRPGIADVVSVLVALGYELHTWSANGADHGRAAAALSGTAHLFAGFWPKPPTQPIDGAEVLATFGWMPDLTIDDKDEFVPGCPFVRWLPGVVDSRQLRKGLEQAVHAFEVLGSTAETIERCMAGATVSAEQRRIALRETRALIRNFHIEERRARALLSHD